MPTFSRVLHVLSEHNVKVSPIEIIKLPGDETSKLYELKIRKNGRTLSTVLDVPNGSNKRVTPSVLKSICRNLDFDLDIFGLEMD